MRRFYFVCSLSLAVIGVTSCLTRSYNTDSSPKEAPSGDNEFHWFGLQKARYDAQPASAKLKNTPWAGNYWPTYQGGVGVRWQTPVSSYDYKDFMYRLPTASELRQMGTSQIAKLSPAEKYDLWNDRYDLNDSTTLSFQQRSFVKNAAATNLKLFGEDKIPTWTGICNGWSLAALKEPQPIKEITVKNSAGQVITFYPDDIKAIASQLYNDFQFQNQTSGSFARRVGMSCVKDDGSPMAIARDSSGRAVEVKCRDVNPATFHLVLGQFIAQNKPFVFDVESTEQIWNQPVVGYKTRLGTPRALPANYNLAASGTVYLVDVVTDLDYVVESAPRIGSSTDQNRFIKTKQYRYTLELDANKEVIGGEWNVNSDMPDFLWYPTFEMDDSLFNAGYPMTYGKVKQLIMASASRNSTPTQPEGSTGGASSGSNPNPVVTPIPVTQPTTSIFVSLNMSISSPMAFAVAGNAQTGAKAHTDSGAMITHLGANVVGANIIRNQNFSLNSTQEEYIRFRSSKDATVVVAVDKRATKDSWLTSRGFQLNTNPGWAVSTNYLPASPYKVYTKQIRAGLDVSIPGQFVDGETGAGRNYVVLVRD